MALNSRMGIFHPQFFYHPRPTVESGMLAKVEIYKPTGKLPEWEGPGKGMSDEGYELIWRGPARIQPDKDWRARVRNFGGEMSGIFAVRVQVPINKNELGPDRRFRKDYRVDIIEAPVEGTETLEGMSLYVRNAVNSANAWLYNLLCDTDTRDG
jgi:hypothetical protein